MDAFKFDEERALDNMASSSMVDLEVGQISLYAVVCINEDGESSHGGQVVEGMGNALKHAREANEEAAESGNNTCKYVPVGIGISMKVLKDIADSVLP